VVAAYFDEKLAMLLARSRGDFIDRIELGAAMGLLSPNEREDLHVIRELRNRFAHRLQENTFDQSKSEQVDQMKTWQIAMQHRPELKEEFPTPKERLLYVAACLYLRLSKRTLTREPLPEPDFHDAAAWPAVSSR
jgi:hypothetical protein